MATISGIGSFSPKATAAAWSRLYASKRDLVESEEVLPEDEEMLSIAGGGARRSMEVAAADGCDLELGVFIGVDAIVEKESTRSGRVRGSDLKFEMINRVNRERTNGILVRCGGCLIHLSVSIRSLLLCQCETVQSQLAIQT